MKLTQEALAKKLGITKAYWSLLERGEKELSGNVIKTLVSTLGVSIDWLVSGDGNPPQSETVSTSRMNKVINEKLKQINASYYKLVQIVELSEKAFKNDPDYDAYLANVNQIITSVNNTPTDKLTFDEKALLIHQLGDIITEMGNDFDELFESYCRDIDHPKRRIKFKPPGNMVKFLGSFIYPGSGS